MKTPEFPRAFNPPPAEPPSAEGREERRVPRYVQAPALRDHGMGPRNLFWGVVMIILALVLIVIAIFFAGTKAMVSVVTCLLTFTALFVLARLHVFRQRNGGFLAVALVCLIGTAIPLAEQAFTAAKVFIGSHRTAAGPAVAAHPEDADAPLLVSSFALAKPQGEGKEVKVVRDSRVIIAEKPFLIKAGDRFSFIETKGGETTFAVRDLRVSLPSNTVEVVDPKALGRGVGASASATPATVEQVITVATNPPGANATAPGLDAKSAAKSTAIEDAELAEITRSAQQEAMRRYPALAMRDSLENAMFISTYKQLREAPGGDNFFANPEWPIELAELLAKREGWNRGGSPITTGPAPVLDAPEDAPAAVRPPTNLPPVDTLDAGSNLPRAPRATR